MTSSKKTPSTVRLRPHQVSSHNPASRHHRAPLRLTRSLRVARLFRSRQRRRPHLPENANQSNSKRYQAHGNGAARCGSAATSRPMTRPNHPGSWRSATVKRPRPRPPDRIPRRRRTWVFNRQPQPRKRRRQPRLRDQPRRDQPRRDQPRRQPRLRDQPRRDQPRRDQKRLRDHLLHRRPSNPHRMVSHPKPSRFAQARNRPRNLALKTHLIQRLRCR